jgi:hypothetical protein
MSTYEAISLLISIAGSLGVIYSLWLLNRQTSIFNRQLMEGITANMTGYSLEISRLFLQHPDLRPYFFSGQTIEDGHPDYLRAEAVAEVILDIFWTMGSQARRIQGEFANPGARALWENYVRDCFATSPILTKFLTMRKDWYGQEMVVLMEQGQAHARQPVS